MTSLDKLLLDTDTNDEFIKRLMSSLVLTTKDSNKTPKGSVFNYYSMYPEFSNASNEVAKETLELMRTVCNFVKPDASSCLPDDMCDSALYDQIVDVVDILLEGADKYINPPSDRKLQFSSTVNQTLLLDKDRILKENLKMLVKPQIRFMTEIDNSRDKPFRPRLGTKYHAITALDLNPHRVPPNTDAEIVTISADTYFAHPYESELLGMTYPKWCEEKVTKVNPSPTYSQSELLYVDTEAAFDSMLVGLMCSNELAVDLEHHSFHTYQGLTCVIQISSREQDYVIDALALRHVLPKLGVYFANPAIVKVLHGCERDVFWLQRDCGLYLVNCFDTHIAAKTLAYSALSLAHLLKMHCGVNADKKHQLADWRQRPLSPEMLQYAREDTRYLLYIYDRLRFELCKTVTTVTTNSMNASSPVATSSSSDGLLLLEHVFTASRKLCLARYEKPSFEPMGYQSLIEQLKNSKGGTTSNQKLSQQQQQQQQETKHQLTAVQHSALAALWEWRDRLARNEDESCISVMGNAELVRIGTLLPRTAVQLEQQCGPLSTLTRTHTADILALIADASSIGPAAAVLLPTTSTGNTSSFTSSSSMDDNNESSRNKRNINEVDSIMIVNDSSTSYSCTVVASAAFAGCAVNTAYTFIPAVVPTAVSLPPTKKTGSNSPKSISNNSSNQSAVATGTASHQTLEEIFRQAGWAVSSTNQQDQLQQQQHPGSSQSPLPPHNMIDITRSSSNDMIVGDKDASTTISEDAALRLQRSREELKKIHNPITTTTTITTSVPATVISDDDGNVEENANKEFQTKLKELVTAASDNDKNATTTASSSSSLSQPTQQKKKQLDEIPRSFDEIYMLSLKNRQRNMEKKRTRDSSVTNNNNSKTSRNNDSNEGQEIENDDDNNEELEYDGSGGLSPMSGSSSRSSHNNSSRNMNKDPTADVTAKSNSSGFDAAKYFAVSSTSAEKVVDCTAAGTSTDYILNNQLAFAREIGWVNSTEECNEIMKEASQYQQVDEDPSTPPSSSSVVEQQQQQLTAGNNSNKVKNTNNAGNNVRKNTTDNSNNSSNANNINIKNTAAAVKTFDYSRIPQGSIGALPSTSSEQTDGRKRNRNVAGAGGISSNNNYYKDSGMGSNTSSTDRDRDSMGPSATGSKNSKIKSGNPFLFGGNIRK